MEMGFLSRTSLSGSSVPSSVMERSSSVLWSTTGITAPTDMVHSGPMEVLNPPMYSGLMRCMSASTDRLGFAALLRVPVPSTMPGAPLTNTPAPVCRNLRSGSFCRGLISPQPLKVAILQPPSMGFGPENMVVTSPSAVAKQL